jgi:hypothetical protein
MVRVEGYIVEILNSNGSMEILWKDTKQPKMFIIRTKLDEPPMSTPMRAANRLLKPKSIYRYRATREIKPNWVNIVLFPDNFLYTTFSSTLPVPKTRWNSIREVFPLHIGPNFQKTKYNQLVLYYLNPNRNKAVRIKNQIDIIHVEHRQLEEPFSDTFGICKNLSTREKEHPNGEKNLIEEIIEKAKNDLNDNSILRGEITLAKQDQANLWFLFEKPKVLMEALKKIGISIKKGGGKHQYKATNPKNGRSAPIPDHPRGLQPYFAKQIAKQLDIPYESLLKAIE